MTTRKPFLNSSSRIVLFVMICILISPFISSAQEPLQKFKFIGDFSSKWEVYEIAKDGFDLPFLIAENNGRICRNKSFWLDVHEPGLFLVVEYKSETMREEFARVVLIDATIQKSIRKKFRIKDSCQLDQTVMITDYKIETVKVGKPIKKITDRNPDHKKLRRLDQDEFEVELLSLAYAAHLFKDAGLTLR